MRTVNKGGRKNWWIVDTPEGVDEAGPYESKAEAETDRVGIAKFLRRCDEPGHITLDDPRLTAKQRERLLRIAEERATDET